MLGKGVIKEESHDQYQILADPYVIENQLNTNCHIITFKQTPSVYIEALI